MLLDGDNNMIVDGSMLSVSTIIGQGLWHTESTVLSWHCIDCLQGSLELSTKGY